MDIRQNQDLFRASIGQIGRESIESQLFNIVRGVQINPPISVQIDLTLRCTAQCLHCHQWAWPEHSDFNFTDFQFVLEKLLSWGVKTIIYSGGNPLLHYEIVAILRLTHKLGFGIGIVSEGYRISPVVAEAISDCAIWIRFSLDGPNAEIHDRIRNRKGIFDDVFYCIKLIKSYNKEVNIGLNIVVQRENIYHLDGMLELSENSLVDTLLFKIPHGEDPLKKYTLTKEDLFYFISWIDSKVLDGRCQKTNLLLLKKMLDVFYSHEDVINGAPTRSLYSNIKCFAPLFSIVIDSHGNVYPCCYLHADNRHWKKSNSTRNEFIVGNILDKDILVKLDKMYRDKVLNLPNKGQKECNNCTRSCQLNVGLTKLFDVITREGVGYRDFFEQYFLPIEEQETELVFL